jgi:hypothetical protein
LGIAINSYLIGAFMKGIKPNTVEAGEFESSRGWWICIAINLSIERFYILVSLNKPFSSMNQRVG